MQENDGWTSKLKMWQQRNKELQAQVERLKSEVKSLHELHELEAH
jgi:uncharacterized protein YlxW (UPF0749 family)